MEAIMKREAITCPKENDSKAQKMLFGEPLEMTYGSDRPSMLLGV